MNPPFDRYSALRVKHAGRSDENGKNGNGKDIYDFYLNVDNIYLRTELKASRREAEVTEARFVYGMVLLGLGLLHQEAQDRKPRSDHEEDRSDVLTEQVNIGDKVEEFTKAVAPVLLPMIDYLGALDLESSTAADASGEVT